jgi:hypothetical protein
MASRFTQSIRRHPIITMIAAIVLAYVIFTLVAMLATSTHISGGYTPAH